MIKKCESCHGYCSRCEDCGGSVWPAKPTIHPFVETVSESDGGVVLVVHAKTNTGEGQAYVRLESLSGDAVVVKAAPGKYKGEWLHDGLLGEFVLSPARFTFEKNEIPGIAVFAAYKARHYSRTNHETIWDEPTLSGFGSSAVLSTTDYESDPV